MHVNQNLAPSTRTSKLRLEFSTKVRIVEFVELKVGLEPETWPIRNKKSKDFLMNDHMQSIPYPCHTAAAGRINRIITVKLE